MSGGKRNFVIGVSLILVCILLISCLPNKQGGFSCICAPLISKMQSMIPKHNKDATSSATTSTATSVVKLEMVAPNSFDVPSELITAIATPNDGGVIESKNMKLTIPQGAVSENTKVVVKELKEPPPFPPYREEYSSLPWVMGISKVYDFGPAGIKFQKPVQIVLSYDENELPLGADEKNVVPLYYNGKDWIAIPGAVDTERNTVSIRTSGFPGVFFVLSIPFVIGAVASTAVAYCSWRYLGGGEAVVAQWAKDPIYYGKAAEYIRPNDPIVQDYAEHVVAETGKNRYESFTDATKLKEILKKPVEGQRLIRFNLGRVPKGPAYEVSKDWANDWLMPEDYVNGKMVGDCKNIANFYCSVLRNLDINAKCVDGYMKGERHVWVELQIGGKPYFIGDSGEMSPLEAAEKELQLKRPKGVKGEGFMWDEQGQVPYEKNWWAKGQECNFVFSCDDCSRFQDLYPLYEPYYTQCVLPHMSNGPRYITTTDLMSFLECWYQHYVTVPKTESIHGNPDDPWFCVKIFSYKTDEDAKAYWPDYVESNSASLSKDKVNASIQKSGLGGSWEITPEGDRIEIYGPSRFTIGRYEGKINEGVRICQLYKNCIIELVWQRPGGTEPYKYTEIKAAEELLDKAVELIEEKR